MGNAWMVKFHTFHWETMEVVEFRYIHIIYNIYIQEFLYIMIYVYIRVYIYIHTRTYIMAFQYIDVYWGSIAHLRFGCYFFQWPIPLRIWGKAYGILSISEWYTQLHTCPTRGLTGYPLVRRKSSKLENPTCSHHVSMTFPWKIYCLDFFLECQFCNNV